MCIRDSLCSIVSEDIDKDYCWHLEDFLEVFESISGRDNFVFVNNKIVYDNGKELSLPTPAEEKKFEFIELNDTEKSLEITGKELDCFKNFEKMRSELKEFPDICLLYTSLLVEYLLDSLNQQHHWDSLQRIFHLLLEVKYHLQLVFLFE